MNQVNIQRLSELLAKAKRSKQKVSFKSKPVGIPK